MSDVEVQAQAFDASNGSGDVDWDSAEETIDFPEGLGNEGNEDNSDDSTSMESNDNESVSEGESEDSESDIQDDDEVSEPSSEDSEESESEQEDDSDGEEGEAESSLPEALQAKGLIEQDGEIGKTITVNGEEQFVTLEELGNDYSGQKELSRRFTEFDNSRRDFNNEVAEVESYIGEFASKMQSGDVVGAFEYFGQFANIAPYQIKESLLQALSPEVERRAIMSAPELQAELLQEQNKYLQDQNESALKMRENEQAQRELQSSVESLRETHEISVEEWTEASDYLKGEIDEREMSPENISEYVVNLRAYNKVDEVLGNLELSDKVDDTYIDSLQKIIKENPDFTDDDLKSLVNDSVKLPKKTSIGKQLKNRQEKSGASKKEVKQEAKKVESGDEYEIDPELEDLFG